MNADKVMAFLLAQARARVCANCTQNHQWTHSTSAYERVMIIYTCSLMHALRVPAYGRVMIIYTCSLMNALRVPAYERVMIIYTCSLMNALRVPAYGRVFNDNIVVSWLIRRSVQVRICDRNRRSGLRRVVPHW
jgi:hypothetical protein